LWAATRRIPGGRKQLPRHRSGSIGRSYWGLLSTNQSTKSRSFLICLDIEALNGCFWNSGRRRRVLERGIRLGEVASYWSLKV
jgi:hypothetical protein